MKISNFGGGGLSGVLFVFEQFRVSVISGRDSLDASKGVEHNSKHIMNTYINIPWRYQLSDAGAPDIVASSVPLSLLHDAAANKRVCALCNTRTKPGKIGAVVVDGGIRSFAIIIRKSFIDKLIPLDYFYRLNKTDYVPNYIFAFI